MRHLGRIALAYLMACIATAFGVKLDIELKRFLDPVVVQNIWHNSPPVEGWSLLVPITVLTGVPASIAILLTEWKRVRKGTYYVAIGTLMGGGLGSIFTAMIITGVLLGALAGWIYWRIAGRHAGTWKRVES